MDNESNGSEQTLSIIPAVPETMRAVTKFTAEHAHEVGLPSPEAVNYMMSIASMLITSALVTQDMEPSGDEIGKRRAAKWTDEAIDNYRAQVVRSNAMAKMLVGHEMGVAPMAALQDVDIVKGKIFVRYPQLIGQMQKQGYQLEWKERSDERATLHVTHANGFDETFSYSFEDAKRAGLTNPSRSGEPSQYVKRPRVMCTARVASEAYRVCGGRANTYTPEEKAEIFREESSMGDPTQADAERMAQMQQKYHVGLKSEAAAPPAPTPTPDPPAPPPQEKPPASGKKADKKPEAKPDNVVQMPDKTEDNPNEMKWRFLVYVEQPSGKVARLENETPQKEAKVAVLRAQALANSTGVSHHVYHEVNGVVNEDPVYIAKPPQKPSAQPQAPQAPAPSAPAPQAQAAPAGGSLRDRLTAITRTVMEIANRGLTDDKKLPEKTIASRVKTFFLGYFSVTKLADLPAPAPETQERYNHAFGDLESAANQDATALLSAPEDIGQRMASGTQRMTELLSDELKWGADNIALVFALMRLRGMVHQDMTMFLENAKLIGRNGQQGWTSASPEDIHAALSLCIKTRQGGRFLRECNQYNMSVAAMLPWMEERRFMGKPLADVAEADVNAAIEWAMTAIREKAESTAKKSAPPAPAAPRKRPEPEPQASAPAAPAGGDDEDELFTELP